MQNATNDTPDTGNTAKEAEKDGKTNATPDAANKQARHQGGTVITFAFILVGMLAALTFAVMQDSRGRLDETFVVTEEHKLKAAQIVAFAGGARAALDRMIERVGNSALITFERPGDASYDTAPHVNKFFHPQGGGFSYNATVPAVVSYHITDRVAISAVGNTRYEISMIAKLGGNDQQGVCFALNLLTRGNRAIHNTVTGTLDGVLGNTKAPLLVDGTGVTENDCLNSGCNGKTQGCYSDANVLLSDLPDSLKEQIIYAGFAASSDIPARGWKKAWQNLLTPASTYSGTALPSESYYYIQVLNVDGGGTVGGAVN